MKKTKTEPTSQPKTCKNCGETKPAEEFYVHSAMGDGRLSFCKPCVKARIALHRQNNLEKVHEYDRKRFKRPDRKAQVLAAAKRRNEKYPEKYSARSAVQYALKSGRLTRQPCEVCGKTEKIQAHHDDYTKPLDVRWMCFKCHREVAHGQKVTVE